MTVDDVDGMPQEDVPKRGKSNYHGGENYLVMEGGNREVVDFDTASNVTNSYAMSIPAKCTVVNGGFVKDNVDAISLYR